MGMAGEFALTGRYYRMFPPARFEGPTEKRLALARDQTALLAVDIYGDTARDDIWSGMVSTSSTEQAGLILRDRIAPALEAARRIGLPVVYAANSAPRIALGRSAYGNMKRDTLEVDQDSLYAERDVDPREYHSGDSNVLGYSDVVAPRDGDYFVRKHVHSAFFETRLDSLLRNLGVRNLICVGFTLDVCLGTTMMDAVYRNYRVVLLRDCTYAIELPGVDDPGSWTDRWITYVESCIGYTATSTEFLETCEAIGAHDGAVQ
jgi:nicotinamidase-related amidase